MRRIALATALTVLLTVCGCSKNHATKLTIGLAVDIDTYPASASPHEVTE